MSWVGRLTVCLGSVLPVNLWRDDVEPFRQRDRRVVVSAGCNSVDDALMHSDGAQQSARFATIVCDCGIAQAEGPRVNGIQPRRNFARLIPVVGTHARPAVMNRTKAARKCHE